MRPRVEQASQPAAKDLGSGREAPADRKVLDADQRGGGEPDGEDEQAAAGGDADGPYRRPPRL
jgi:hypothetical protein